MPELANCPKCGKVFTKAFRSVCSACHDEVERQFQEVYAFIRKRENRRATMEEVEEGTGVDREQIVTFVREGRILTSQFPGLSYPCESCGAEIREGRLCGSCKGNIQDGLKRRDSEAAFEQRKTDRSKERYTTYHSLGDRVNKDRR
ncbi:TIGR03826 family flagellar region protein [Alkalicoccus chagannorensis]|uniref:TIGR03826 family flagellar region protein n=1 Tax=Alkalicoccus chagannorensis TaxID=427072 RepID=UPI0003FB272C|nr:TIGR03826 family flagellar region protein [Alkalicoccus chagannorensis]